MSEMRPLRALVIADGDIPTASQLSADMTADLVIAADGGLQKARALGLSPSVVVGDGDSLTPAVLDELAATDVEVQLHPRQKDRSDTELAVREAIRRGCREVVVIGALGGRRFDHSLANVLLLAAADLGAEVSLVTGTTRVSVIGRHGADEIEISGEPGDYVSLLPLSTRVEGVTTTGLAYPLNGAALVQGPTLGLSNELVTGRATVHVEQGRLAVIHTRRGGPE